MHEHNENCGCMHEHDENCELMHIQLEDGSDVACEVVTILEIDGCEYDYIVLAPVEDEELNVMIFRYIEDENGDVTLDNIGTDEEFEKVSAVFDDWYDEMVGEIDEEALKRALADGALDDILGTDAN